MLERALQHGERAADGGVKQLARVVGFEVEGRRGVRDCVDAFDGFVECAFLRTQLSAQITLSEGVMRRKRKGTWMYAYLGDIFDNDDLELISE